MSESDSHRVLVIGSDGQPVGYAEVPAQLNPGSGEGGDGQPQDGQIDPADAIGEPAKVMRIGTMVKQLLDEVRSAPLDDAARGRLAEIHARSLRELEEGLSPMLVAELRRITLPFTDETPTDAELRIAQAQLVGWLEGLFHGIQTAVVIQQMATQVQPGQSRRSLPPGTPGLLLRPDGDDEDPRPATVQYL